MFLMNCPVNYCEDPITTTSPSHPQLSPSTTSSSLPMNQRSLQPTTSSRGGVETKSNGTKVPSPSHTYKYAQKNVLWKDALFPQGQGSSPPTRRTFPREHPSLLPPPRTTI